MPAKMIQLTNGKTLHGLTCEKRTRRNSAHLIRDARSGTLLLTQKLRLAVEFMNEYLAQSEMEKVSVASLFEATGTDGNRVNGFHKLRYHVSRCDLSEAHGALEAARAQPGTRLAIILTNYPECYAIT